MRRNSLTCLGDADCKVRFARGDLLDLLHDVRAQDEGFVARLAGQLTHDLEVAGNCEPKSIGRPVCLSLRPKDGGIPSTRLSETPF